MRSDVMEHLSGVFGLAQLRPEQALAVEAFIAGRDVLLVLPTGFGKSLCFQLPAVTLARAGLGCTLVVSPLIALMDDQVRSLRERGVRAAALHSGVPWSEQRAVLADASSYELVYVSPERLENARVRSSLRAVARVAIDEAHCISEWGHDFRPEYAALGWIKRELGLPVMALTATATARVREHIVTSLELIEPLRLAAGNTRPNLQFRVAFAKASETRTTSAIELLRAHGFASKRVDTRAIVYANTRARVQAVQRALRKAGIRAGYYHAGRSEGARRTAEERFRGGMTPVLVATSAFGMGVDFSMVQLVLHVEAPGTLESYVQQAGRAGRDGKPAQCWLAFSAADAKIHERLRAGKPTAPTSGGFAALEAYAFGEDCRQLAIARHFELAADGPCGSCDICSDPAATRALREQAASAVEQATRERKRRHDEQTVALSERERAAIVAFVDAMPKPVGRRYVMMALRGSRARVLGKKRLLTNPHFAALRGVGEETIFRALDELLAEGLLVRKGKKYPTLWVAGKAVRAARARAPREAVGSLEAALRRFRRNEARRRRIKPYQVFQDRTLRALCAQRPLSMPQLREVWGIGEERLDKYGTSLLELCTASG
jgi:ATP-dependent DNA helicase RecQ